MKPRAQAIAELEARGYQFKRHGANHDIYFHPQLGAIMTLKRHDFDESDLRYIKKELNQNEQRRG